MRSKIQFLFSFVLTFAVRAFVVFFRLRVTRACSRPGRSPGLPLKKRGLKIKPEEIYNPAGGGLTEAVIRLSVGCTAEFVSPEGLDPDQSSLRIRCIGFSFDAGQGSGRRRLQGRQSRPARSPAKDYSIFDHGTC